MKYNKIIILGIITIMVIPFTFAAEISSCSYINEDTNLTGNISVDTDSCLNINASSIVLDCQGFSIIADNYLTGLGDNGQQNDVTIKNCNFVKGTTIFQDGAFIDQSNGWYWENNTFSDGDSANVELKNVANHSFNGFYTYDGVNTLRLDNSNYIEINNSRFYRDVSTGFDTVTMLNGVHNVTFWNATFEQMGNSQSSLGYNFGIFGDGAKDIFIYNSNGSNAEAFYTTAAYYVSDEGTVYFVNSTNMDYDDTFFQGSGEVHKSWFYYVSANYSDGSPAVGATVNIYDKDDNLFASGITNSEGYVRLVASELKQNSTSTYYFSNYSINGSLSGNTTDTINSNLTTSTSIQLTMSGVEAPSVTPACVGATTNFTCGDTITESCTLNSNLTSAASCLIIGADDVVVDGAGYNITGPGANYGVYFQNQNNITVKNLIIDNFARGIYFDGTNTTTIQNVTTNANNGEGIRFGATSDNYIVNSIIGGTIGIRGAGAASNNVFQDSSVTGGINHFAGGGNETLLNTSLSGSVSLSAGQVWRKWYFDVYVNDSAGSALSSANVTAYRNTGTVEWSALTDGSGNIAKQNITEYLVDGAVTTYYTNYTINSTKTSYNEATKSINFTDNANTFLTMSLSNTAPTITAITLSPSTVYTSTGLTASLTYNDTDADSGTVYWTLYVNGTANQTGSNASVADGSIVTFTFNSTNYAKGDTLIVEAYANDGTANSSFANSSSTVVQNSAPDNFILSSPNDGQVDRGDLPYTVNFSWSSSADNDSDTITYYLYVDGTLNASLSGTSTNIIFYQFETINWYVSANDTFSSTNSSTRTFTIQENLATAGGSGGGGSGSVNTGYSNNTITRNLSGEIVGLNSIYGFSEDIAFDVLIKNNGSLFDVESVIVQISGDSDTVYNQSLAKINTGVYTANFSGITNTSRVYEILITAQIDDDILIFKDEFRVVSSEVLARSFDVFGSPLTADSNEEFVLRIVFWSFITIISVLLIYFSLLGISRAVKK